jgi:biotin carboxyl carrier protein
VRYYVTLPSANGEFAPVAEVDLRERDGLAFQVTVDGRPVDLDFVQAGPWLNLRVDGRVTDVVVHGRLPDLEIAGAFVRARVQVESERTRSAGRAGTAATTGTTLREGALVVKSPMPGRVVRVLVTAGDHVEAGQALVVLEAMKMENEVRASIAGTVADVAVSAGHTVESGARLLTLRANAASP